MELADYLPMLFERMAGPQSGAQVCQQTLTTSFLRMPSTLAPADVAIMDYPSFLEGGAMATETNPTPRALDLRRGQGAAV